LEVAVLINLLISKSSRYCHFSSFFRILVSATTILKCLAFVAFLFTTQRTVHAQTSDFSKQFFLVDNIVSIEFKPKSAYFAFSKDQSKALYLSSAHIVEEQEAGEGLVSQGPYYLVSFVDKGLFRDGDSGVFGIFVIKGENQEVFFSSFVSQELKDLLNRPINEEDLLKQIELLPGQIENQKKEIKEIDRKLNSLGAEVNKLGEIDYLVKLEKEVHLYKRLASHLKDEETRLTELINVTQNYPELDSANKDSANDTLALLSQQLKETVQVTSVVERMTEQQRTQVAKTFDERIKLIQEADNIDMDKLYFERDRLRKVREELEGLVNTTQQ